MFSTEALKMMSITEGIDNCSTGTTVIYAEG